MADQLDPAARDELSTLPGDLADAVARQLIAASIDDDPDRGYRHAQAARRLAARVGVVRETCGIAAYRAGAWADALTELRAARRLTGRSSYLPMMADCERALGRLDRALAPLELRSREFWLLAIAGPGNVPQNEIADLCGLDPSSLVAVLDGLERRGWVRRERNPHDRRMHWVQRTEAGDRLFARALPRAQRAEAGQLAVLSASQQRQLVTAMRKLVMISK